jgi:hypothetical protein
VTAVITLRDPSLYQRLQRLLPRPDYPIDELIRRLIEQPGKVSIEKLMELERRMAEIDARIGELLGRLDALERAVASVREALETGGCQARPYIALLVPARLEEGAEPSASQPAPQPAQQTAGSPPAEEDAGSRPGRRISLEEIFKAAVEIAKRNGGCVRFSELAGYFGRKPKAFGREFGGRVSKLLIRHGFIRKDKGLYCLERA